MTTLSPELIEKARSFREQGQQGQGLPPLSDNLRARAQELRAAAIQDARDNRGTMSFINRGIAEALGSPVDLTNMLLNVVGLGSNKPIGGSESITEFLNTMGEITGATNEVASTRPPRTAGESIARGVGTGVGALAPVGAASRFASALPQATTATGRGIQTLARETARRPGLAATSEISAGAGAGQGEFVGGKTGRGDVGNMVGALIGGLVPGLAVSTLAGAGSLGRSGISQVTKGATKAGGRKVAAERLAELAGSGAGIQAARQGLNDRSFLPDAPLTPAQRTQNRGILTLERALREEIPELDDALTAANRETAAKVKNAISTAVEGGRASPQSTREFIGEQREYILGLLSERARKAGIDAQRRVNNLASADPSDMRRQSSLIVREEIQKALDEAEIQENQLWNAVDLKATVQPSSTMSSLNEAAADLTRFQDASDLPSSIRKMLTQQGGKLVPRLKQVESSRDLQGQRSLILQEARAARRDGNRVAARMLERVQSAILEDMSNAPSISESYRTALDFSRSLNDRFRRGTVGRLLKTRGSGDLAVAPELTLAEAIGSGGEGARLAAQEILHEATKSGKAAEQIRTFMRAQFATQATRDGKVVPSLAESFVRKQTPLLDALGMRSELSSASAAQLASDRIGDAASATGRRLANKAKSAVGLFLDAPIDREIPAMLGAKDPANVARSLQRLVRRRDPSGLAERGLKTGLLDHILEGASDVDGNLSPDRLKKQVEATRKIANVLLNKDEIKRLQTAVRTLEVASQRAGRLGAPISASSSVLETIGRVLGARLGRGLDTGTIQAPGIMSERGRDISRRLIQKAGVDKAKSLLVDAAQDKSLMDSLLVDVDQLSPQRQDRIFSRWNAWLLAQSGGRDAGTFDEENDDSR